MLAIEKNVPLRPPVSTAGRRRKYPLPLMEVGDSFFANHGTTRAVLHSSIRHYITSTGSSKKFATRSEGNGYRVWRTK